MKEKEIERLNLLKEEENKLYDQGIEYICGIDEAGRGPLAIMGRVRRNEDEKRQKYSNCSKRQ